MITTSVVFDHRGRTKKNQPGPLEIRMTVNRKPYYINTGVRVLRAEFKYGAIVNRPDSDELNERLDIIGRRVEHEINLCIEKNVVIDVAEIRRRVLDVGTGDGTDFLDWVDERIEIIRPTLAEGTMKHYRTLRNKLREYDKLRRWQDVTVDGILLWDSWLHTQTKPLTKNQLKMGIKPEPLGDAGVYNYHKNLKKLLYIAKKVKVINENPYADLKGEFARGDKENVEYLTEDEMYAIINLKVQRGSHLDIVRDMFVMQMFTGMSYADLMKFDINDYKEVDGRWVTNSDRVKSGVAFVAHLLPPVVEVLKKYGMEVPRVSNQVYNRSLKTIAERAGITTNLHTHLARHTFATYMLTNEVQLVNVQRMLGHKDIKQTQRYAKTLALSVHNEFDKIEEKLKRKNK